MNILSRYIISLLAGLAALLAVGCTSSDSVNIRGHLAGLEDSKIYLCGYDETLVVVDSTLSTKGSFLFKLPRLLPDIFFIRLAEHPDHLIPVIADKGDIIISGNLGYKDDISISGSPSNDALASFREGIRSHEIMIKAVDMRLKELDIEDENQIEEIVILTAKKDSIENVIREQRVDFIRTNPDSIIAAMFAVMAISDPNSAPVILSLISEMDSSMDDNAFLRRLKNRYADAM